MAKMKKQFKNASNTNTANVKVENVKSVNNVMSVKSGVNKKNIKKHDVKLPDNFKKNIKKGDLLARIDVENIVTANPKNGKEKVTLKPNVQTNKIDKTDPKNNAALKFKDEKKNENGLNLVTSKKQSKEIKINENPKKHIEKDQQKKVNVVQEAKTSKEKTKMKTYKNPKKDSQQDQKGKNTNIEEKKSKTVKNKDIKSNLVETQTKQEKIVENRNNVGSSSKETLKNKLKKKQKKAEKKKSQQKVDVPLSDIIPGFDEEQFFNIVNEENVLQLIEALKNLVSVEVKKMKNKMFADYKYMLNVACFKIPSCPKRYVKLKLKHPMISEDDDVCLIVKDLQRGRKVDFEDTIHHYEDLFKKHDIKGIKTIMPFRQLKDEYNSFEMKKKLSNLYDYFVCDGAIVGHVVGFLGKIFQQTRCIPYAVRMQSKNLADELKKSLHKTSYKQGEKGTLISIPVGTDKMSPEQICENILTIISQLKNVYPGGLPNIRNIYGKINILGTTAIPMYMSPYCPPEETPIVIGPREEKMKKLKTEVNEILTKFQMTTTGNLVEKNTGISLGKKRQQDDKENTGQTPIKKKKLTTLVDVKEKVENSKKTEAREKAQKSVETSSIEKKKSLETEKVKENTKEKDKEKIILDKAKTLKSKGEEPKKKIEDNNDDSDETYSDDELHDEVKAEEVPSTDESLNTSTGSASNEMDDDDDDDDESDDEDENDGTNSDDYLSSYASSSSDEDESIQTNGIKGSEDDDDDDDEESDDDDDEDDDDVSDEDSS